MKKLAPLFVVVSLLFALSGCAFFNQIYPPPSAPVCSKPEAEGSVICATAVKLGITPEQIDSMFLDAAAVGIGTKLFKADELKAAMLKAKDWVQNKKVLTIDGLVKYLVTEAQLDPALSAVLSRRLGLINLPDLGVKPVTQYDVSLILAGIDHQLDQLTWF